MGKQGASAERDVQRGPDRASLLAARIAAAAESMTPSFRRIANYMLDQEHLLAFETAATIAEKVGVNQMTVGRFLRTLGYGGISELKAELRGAAASGGMVIADRLARIRDIPADGEQLHDNLQKEVNALISVYEHVGSPAWHKAIALLTSSDDVFVLGFQTIAGIAADFTARLQYLRPRATFLDGADGTFAQLLAGPARKPVLVLFDHRRYSRHSRMLAIECRNRSIPVLLICDSHCAWAHNHADVVLMVSTDTTLFWDSQAPFLSLTNLLLDQVVRKSRKQAAKRIKALNELQDLFGLFD